MLPPEKEHQKWFQLYRPNWDHQILLNGKGLPLISTLVFQFSGNIVDSTR